MVRTLVKRIKASTPNPLPTVTAPTLFPMHAPRTLLARRGFTLIELLTVIAIIGILAAILIPTVGKVRAVAKSANCVSNLREMGRMSLMFANDNRGRMPSAVQSGSNLAPYYYSSATVPKSYGIDQIAYSLWPYYDRGTAKTGGTTETSAPSLIPMLMCPAHSPEIPTQNALHYVLNLNTAPTDSPAAGYNIFPYGSVRAINRMVTINTISRQGLTPSKTWLMQDYDTAAGDATRGIAAKPHHDNKRNRLFIDGSVRSLPLAEANLAVF